MDHYASSYLNDYSNNNKALHPDPNVINRMLHYMGQEAGLVKTMTGHTSPQECIKFIADTAKTYRTFVSANNEEIGTVPPASGHHGSPSNGRP